MEKKFSLILGDCLEAMKEIKSESINCIITDPPFNISQKNTVISRSNLTSNLHRRNSDVNLDFGDWDIMGEKEFKDFTEKWFKECVRILKNGGWFYSFFSKERVGYFTCPLTGLFQENGFKTRSILTWCKSNPVPSFRKMNYLSGTEFIVVGSKGESKLPNFLQQKQMKNWFKTSNSSAYGETEHPTEKPLDLLRWLIMTGSNEQETVLDCFMGSGSVGRACMQLNRNFIGIELNEKYFQMAEKRISAEANQTKLFFGEKNTL